MKEILTAENSNAYPLLAAQAISKRFADEQIIDHVSLSILPGEILSLIGPNGAGKTTLLKLLLGLETPDSGRIVRAENLSIGYVPQHFFVPISMPLTLEHFLSLGAKNSSAQRITEVLHELNIASLAQSPLHGLSGGQMRRALIARALLQHPRLLVLDEPVQGVDIAGQSELYRLIEHSAKQRGAAVLMVSHDLFVVMASTHRVLCLNRHICCEGAPEHVGSHPAFIELFGSDVAAQLATYHHRHDHHHDTKGAVIHGIHGKGCEHA